MNNIDSNLPTLPALVRGPGVYAASAGQKQGVSSLSMLLISVNGQGIRRQGAKLLKEKQSK